MIVVDPELKAFIPPLSSDERASLEAEIVAAGRAVDPIAVWSTPEGDVIVDGHHRFEICQAHNLPFALRYVQFDSRDEAKSWMLDHQLARRNLTADQVVALAALRGIDPPAGFRGLAAQKTCAELVAAGAADALAPVLAGKSTARVAWLRWRERNGQAGSRKQRARTSPAPLESARAAQNARDEVSADRQALRAALDALARAESTLDARAAIASAPPVAMPTELPPGERVCTAVALLSDVHYGASFPEAANTFGNRYSPAIAAFRLNRFFAATRWNVKHYRLWGARIDRLVLACAGDLVDGHLHDEQVETSLAPLESARQVYPILASGVRFLEQEVHTTVIGAYGNHGRLTQKIRHITGARHNVEHEVYRRLAEDFPGQVTAEPCEDQYLDVYDWTLHVTHGTGVRYQGGIQGVQTPLNKAAMGWRAQRPDKSRMVHLLGHLHTLLFGGSWLLNGSIVGYGPHAAFLRCAPELPAQWFFLIDSKRGPTNFTPLWVSDAKDEVSL